MATGVMPRSKRTLSNQGLYHVYNRAELGQPIFDSDGAKAVFLETILQPSSHAGQATCMFRKFSCHGGRPQHRPNISQGGEEGEFHGFREKVCW